MSKKFIFAIFLFLAPYVQADIIEINQIEDIRSYITQKDTLVLFDIDDTLITNSVSVGSPPWRNWVKNKLSDYKADFVVFDALTLYMAQKIPYKPVEANTVALIADLQSDSIPVFAFTSRGRSQWYTTDIAGVDHFTHLQLNNAGIDFKQTAIPNELQKLEPAYFYEGIIFAEHIKKGDLLKHLFKDLNYNPSCIIFIDDKLDQVKSVESALQEIGVPFIGFWYRRAEFDGANFKPVIANVQLEYLLLEDTIIGHAEAEEIVAIMPDIEEQHHLSWILNQIDFNVIKPSFQF